MIVVKVEDVKKIKEALQKEKLEVYGRFEIDGDPFLEEWKEGTIGYITAIDWRGQKTKVPVIDTGKNDLFVWIDCLGTNDYYNLLEETVKILEFFEKHGGLQDISVEYSLDEYDDGNGRLYNVYEHKFELIPLPEGKIVHGYIDYRIYDGPDWKFDRVEHYVKALTSIKKEHAKTIFAKVWEENVQDTGEALEIIDIQTWKGLRATSSLRINKGEFIQNLMRGIHWVE